MENHCKVQAVISKPQMEFKGPFYAFPFNYLVNEVKKI